MNYDLIVFIEKQDANVNQDSSDILDFAEVYQFETNFNNFQPGSYDFLNAKIATKDYDATEMWNEIDFSLILSYMSPAKWYQFLDLFSRVKLSL